MHSFCLRWEVTTAHDAISFLRKRTFQTKETHTSVRMLDTIVVVLFEQQQQKKSSMTPTVDTTCSDFASDSDCLSDDGIRL
ncbi:uncharacterized protein V6R79_016262 [Siganus canaliculatus]